jgi:hypothetical protein
LNKCSGSGSGAKNYSLYRFVSILGDTIYYIDGTLWRFGVATGVPLLDITRFGVATGVPLLDITRFGVATGVPLLDITRFGVETGVPLFGVVIRLPKFDATLIGVCRCSDSF